MKRAIYPLYAPADESRVKPILDALKKKGVTVRAADPRKGDALMLFLSENVAADSPEADAFFRLNAGRALVIPAARNTGRRSWRTGSPRRPWAIEGTACP